MQQVLHVLVVAVIFVAFIFYVPLKISFIVERNACYFNSFYNYSYGKSFSFTTSLYHYCEIFYFIQYFLSEYNISHGNIHVEIDRYIYAFSQCTKYICIISDFNLVIEQSWSTFLGTSNNKIKAKYIKFINILTLGSLLHVITTLRNL